MDQWRQNLLAGQVIPACPLALTEDGEWSKKHQRGLLRYYLAAGVGGLAIGVHSTQFAIRESQIGLYEPLLRFVAQTIQEQAARTQGFCMIAGVCGRTPQAVREAALASELGYSAALLSLSGLHAFSDEELLQHCRAVAAVMPIIGFYLQPAVGGRVLSYRFWRSLADVEPLVAIKVAPFDRYLTGDVMRAVLDSGRQDIALYTGNDDNIIGDLLTSYEYAGRRLRFVGGLLGQWGVWTQRAVELLEALRKTHSQDSIDPNWLTMNAQLTDANGAIFDAANGFSGCIPGIHEVLRRQGLLISNRCLDPQEQLSPGQGQEISRVQSAYPHLTDDDFVRQHLSEWLS